MSIYQWLSIILSLIAIFISIFSLIKSNKANDISMGQLELHVHDSITSSSQNVQDMAIKIAPLSCKKELDDEEKKLLEIYKAAFKTAIENNLNAYESACQKYIDGKIDKKRFKKSYMVEIRNLVKSKDYRDTYFNRNSTDYYAILKVYDKWENLEND